MKIYDMIEGVWLKLQKEKEKPTEDYKHFDVSVRLVTYDEEREWLERERTDRDR